MTLFTKKLLVGYDPQNPDKTSGEFLGVGFKDENFHFVGLESKKIYEYGMIVYLGKEITGTDIIEKANKSKIKDDALVFSGEVLNQYIELLKDFKIGNKLSLQSVGKEIKLIKHIWEPGV